MPKLGDATAIKIGSTTVSKVYQGTTQVWPTGAPPAPSAYLNTVLSRASTPDPNPSYAFPFLFKAKLRGPQTTGTGDQTIVSQYAASNRAFNLVRRGTSGVMTLNVTTDGATLIGLSGGTIDIDKVNPIYIAMTYEDTGSNTYARRYLSADGVSWTLYSTLTSSARVTAPIFNSTQVLRIGGKDADSSIGRWDDRIYWVEMRTGLDPAAGTLQWRFDATEHSSGTSWTDPRGLTWTITDAAALVHE